MKQAPEVQGWIGYISLPYISDLLSSELDFVFLEELSAQSGRKGERYRKYGDQCKGKNSWGGGKNESWSS